MQEKGELKGLKIIRGVKVATLAQFAYDTIMLGGSSTVIAERFKKVLDYFLKASDGKVNTVKSKVYGWNCSPSILNKIARVLGFKGKHTWKSFNYPETPIFI